MENIGHSQHVASELRSMINAPQQILTGEPAVS